MKVSTEHILENRSNVRFIIKRASAGTIVSNFLDYKTFTDIVLVYLYC